jgi:hypothetical protein
MVSRLFIGFATSTRRDCLHTDFQTYCPNNHAGIDLDDDDEFDDDDDDMDASLDELLGSSKLTDDLFS